MRDGQTLTRQENVRAEVLKAHLTFLVGEGFQPNIRTVDPFPADSRQVAANTPIQVNETNFEREKLRANKPVVVHFWAPLCALCQMVELVLKSLAREQAGTLKVAKVNVDENPNLASRYGAMSIPTILVMVDGREVDRWVGALPENAIRSRVARWIQQKSQTA